MKPLLRAVGVLAAFGLTLSACSAHNGSSGGSASGVAADGSATVKAKTLTVWTNAADPAYVTDAYANFGKKFGVTMNIVKIPADTFESQVQTKWASGDRPDLLEYHSTSLFWALNPASNMIDMSKMPYVAKSADVYKSGGSYQGKVYAAITSAPTLFGIYYNKKTLADAGLSAPRTFADIENICTTLKQKDPTVTPLWESGGSAWPTQILPLLYVADAEKAKGYSTELLDKKTTMDDPSGPFDASMVEYKKLQSMGCYNKDATTAKFEDSIKAVATGTTAMTALHSGLVSMFAAQFGNDLAKTSDAIGWASPSASDANAVWAPSVSGTWYVPRTGDTAKESSALAFVQWITSAGYQDYVNAQQSFPILSGFKAPDNTPMIQQQIQAAYEANRSLAFNTNLVGFNSQFATWTTGLLSGQYSPQQVGGLAQKALAQGAKTAELPGW